MEKVLVAMSGGVDSCVTALLLREAGYQCIGVTMRMLCSPSAQKNAEDAAEVCRMLGVEHITLDETELFSHSVIDRFVTSYEQGLTPNPCIFCNRDLKFGRLWQLAQELGCDYLATGHYAQVVKDEEGQAHLYRGKNPLKDQSYVLWPVPQRVLQHVLLPLGTMESKEQVRQLAQDHGFATAFKSDSQDICFIPEGDYVQFLKDYTNTTPEPGPIVDEFGQTIGTHKGLISYTLGQRKGVGVAAKRKIYVTGKDAQTNTLFVGANELLYVNQFTVAEANWISGQVPDHPVQARVCATYQGHLFDALVEPLDANHLRIRVEAPMRAVCPGQSCVGYVDDEVLFGGVIEPAERPLRTAMQDFLALECQLDIVGDRDDSEDHDDHDEVSHV